MKIRKAVRNKRLHDGTKTDQRSPSQRDRDRVIHCAALRRLAGVTQVVDPAEGHVFHNRLTHTLKVAQVGRRIAEKFLREYQYKELANIGFIDPEVVEAAALLHDLGHPPFGHVSEQVLDRKVLEKAETIMDGYEGNAQSFRIATRLEIRQPDAGGMNLTRATLNALLKYPWLRHNEGKAHEKWGAYRDDSEYLDWVREPFDALDMRGLKTVEAEIMDWADDIAFSVHDLEDFYRAGLIPLDRLTTDEEARNECLKIIFDRWKRNPREGDEEIIEPFTEAFHSILELLPLKSRYDGSVRQRAHLNLACSNLIDSYVTGTSLDTDPARFGDHLVVPSNLRLEVKALKQLIWVYVIDSPALATQQFGKSRIIEELFDIIFDEAMNTKETKWSYILPSRYRSLFLDILRESDEVTRTESRARLAADYISSMTDNEAISIHRRLTGINSGTLRDMNFA